MKKLIPLFLLVACSSPKEQDQSVEIQEVSLGVTVEDEYPKMLSDWGFFKGDLSLLSPADGVFPYELNSPLFTDYAFKKRFIKLPKGTKMTYIDSEVFDFPDETVLIKNFYYPADFASSENDLRILETRLLIKEGQKWKPIVYVWNDEQTDAKRQLLGEKKLVEWKDEQGGLQKVNYEVPSQPQCKSCHEFNGKVTPIGPSARQLNNNGQLESWAKAGLIDLPDFELPKLANYENESVSLADRARAWLEINCAHCHRKEGPAKNTGMYLLASQSDNYKLGVNKPPVAAGRGSAGLKYGIVPGEPDQSILLHRIETLEPGEMMPELGRTIRHEEGIQLIRDWIASMNR